VVIIVRNAFIVFVVLIILFGCATSKTATSPYERHIVGIMGGEKEMITAYYTISSSRVYSLVKIWLAEQFWDGIEEIQVDDSMNGILAGTSSVPVGGISDLNEYVRYKIFFEDNSVTLHIENIGVFGAIYAESRDAANSVVDKIFFNYRDNIVKTFQEIF
jgi:hypothetical protein